MWTRVELKSRAKEALRQKYWMGFAVCFIAGIIMAIPSTINQYFNMIALFAQTELPAKLIGSFAIIFILFSVFVANVLSVGIARYFLQSREVECDVGLLFFGFRRGSYINVAKTMFFRDLFIGLWSLLFVIPGIVKSYEYFLVPYILAENPDIEWREALALSKKMTYGHKLDIFILGLSFLGWALLGILLCFIGVLFLDPYINATYAELYTELKRILNEKSSTF